MGIDWMSWAALVEAIPPAYTRWIGASLLNAVTPPAARDLVGAVAETLR